MQIDEVITAHHSPFQNPYAERVIGSIDGPRNFGAAAGPHDNPLGSIEDGLLQKASCASLQTGHQLSAIQIATSKWKLASGQPTQAVFMHNTDFLLWTPPCC